MTSLLLGINVLVYLVMALAGHRLLTFDRVTLILAGANAVLPPDVVSAAPTHWRWLTATFIHVNLAHLLMNMYVLIQLGVLSERFVGGGVLAAAYVVTGVCGNVLSTVWAHHRGLPLLSAGASGGIMGLLGMVAVLTWIAGLRPLSRALLKNAGFVLILGAGLAVAGPGLIDNGAHVGGLLAGAALGGIRARWRRPLPGAVSLVLVVAALAFTATAFVNVLTGHGTR